MISPEPQRTLLHYRLLHKLDSGGMGEVYKAEDTKLGRTVAIKFLLADVSRNPIARRRFLQEAQSASVLNHPNIVTIHAIEEANGVDFIVMEFVEGRNLKNIVDRDGALPLSHLLDIAIQASDALQAAHEVKLVHRDIKSANILVTQRGQAKMLDFGLAKSFRTSSDGVDQEAPTLANLTDEGTVLGTAAYMSPEQTLGQPLDHRSDIFSLGCVIYEASTRSLPFSGPSVLSMMHAISTIDPTSPSRLRPELPRELDLIIERAMAKDREKRYSSAEEMADALRTLRGTLTTDWRGGPIVYDKDLIVATSASPFVGRGPELSKLSAFLEQAIDGTGRVVFITGEPGIGKTSLSDEFLRRARTQFPSLSISRGRCVEQYGTGEAYLPFLDAMGSFLNGPARDRLASIMRTSAPTWCSQLPAAFSSTGAIETLQQETIGATKERMMREMGDALSVFASTSPVVILLEDLHWADPSSVDLLRHLCQRISNQRLLIAGTFRPEDLERSNHPLKTYKAEMQAHRLCEEIALDSLSPAHIQEYLNVTFAPHGFPPEFAAQIYEKTEGHPLFATSLLQYLHERGDIAQSNDQWMLTRPLQEMNLEAPESVRSMINKQVHVLDEQQRRALQYASVEGQEFLSTVTARLLGMDEVDVEELLAQIEKTHRLIVTSGEEDLPDGSLATRYRFAHALYQNFLYDDLVAKRRVMLHRQVGEQLERHYGKRASQIATQLALHFERGREFARAIEFLIHAGDNATTLYGYSEANDHYTHALSLVQKLPVEQQSEMMVTLYKKRGATNMALSRFSQSADDYESMLKHLDDDSAEQRASGLNALSTTLFFSHRVEEMETRANEALAAARSAGSETLRLDTMWLMALNHLCYGELAQARPILDDVIKSARAISYKPALLAGITWRGCLYFFQTEYERAIECEQESRKLGSQLRDGFSLLTSMFFFGLSKANLGYLSEGIATLEEAMKMARRNGDAFWFPRMPNCIGWMHRELQDFEGAFERDREGLQVAREYHVLEAEANSLINLGIDHTYEGKPEKTEVSFKETRDIFERDAWFRWRYNIRLEAATAWHWLRQGNLEKASEYAQRLLDTATVHEVHKYIAEAYRLKARIAVARKDFDTATKEFTSALDELNQFPAPLTAWKTYADLGRLEQTRGNALAARESFSRASEIIHMVASNVSDEKLRTTFLNSKAVGKVMAGAANTAAGSSSSIEQ